ncbi:zf-RVT domain-containing protein [Cephalotus follicularis]|uniref:Zf-RVT domain-containing protein n=1 Tax=Cephalotus follicularis TaxID=3775 RepID=A0A1Q3DKK4_CEPFO|nr:zf-RVT domain-containing protein [Cephalotus follicularis]
MKTWNQALLLKQIWNLLTDHSLWVQWCKKYLIRKHSFWNLPSAGYHSWSWRQILLLRNVALQHLVYVCGKGDSFSLWYDPWFHGNSIHALYGHRVIYDAGMQGTELVQSVIANGQWNWPVNSPQLLDIHQRVQDIPISSAMDQIFWERQGKLFSSKAAWSSIRVPAPAVGWARMVWHHTRIPKQAFYLWLSILGALKTRDKLFLLGIVPSACCSFNCGEDESIAHLFFACPFSQSTWKAVLGMCNIYRQPLPWQQEIQWMEGHARGKKFPQTLRKLAFGATVYHIWMERNRRSFKNRFLPQGKIIQKIQGEVAAKLLSIEPAMAQIDENHHSLGCNWGMFG